MDLFLILSTIGSAAILLSWEDHPDKESRFDVEGFKSAQDQTKAGDQGEGSYHKEIDSPGPDVQSSRGDRDWFGVPDRDK